MYRPLLKLLLSLLLLPLAAVAVPGASAAGDDGAKAKPAAKAPETISRDYQKEIDLLRAAADKLAAVNSEESAKDSAATSTPCPPSSPATRKKSSLFRRLATP